MIKKFMAAIFALLAVSLAVVGVWLSFDNMNAEPILLEAPEAARQLTVSMMDALCAGEYGQVSQMLYGQPELGMDQEAADPVGLLFHEAYEESLSYRVTRDCYATNRGVAMDVQVSGLDITGLTAMLRQKSQQLLEQRVAEAEDISEAEQLYAIACTDPDDECMYQVVYDIPLDELSIDVFKHSETKIFCGKKPAKVFVALDPEKETDEIVADYNKAKVVAENHYMGPVEVMEYDYTVEDLTSLGVFGEALKMLSRADIAYFPVGWEESCVCRFFHGAAQCEGKQIIEG